MIARVEQIESEIGPIEAFVFKIISCSSARIAWTSSWKP